MRNLSLVIVTLVVACLASSRLTSAREAEQKLVKPLIALHGSKSEIVKAGYHRIDTEQAWRQLWRDHAIAADQKNRAHSDPSTQVEVDFTRCMVVAAFDGKGFNSLGYEAHSVVETDEAVILRVQSMGYATAGNVEPHPCAAWGMFVLPRSSKPVVIELDTGSRKQGITTWTRVAEFKATP